MSDISILINIGPGSFDSGFQVRSQVFQNGKNQGDSRIHQQETPNFQTTLSATTIPRLYESWSRSYQGIAQQTRGFTIPPQVTNVGDPIKACQQEASALELFLRDWLHSQSFQTLRAFIKNTLRGLGVTLDTSLPIVFYINTGNEEADNILKRLPWHLWLLFTDLCNAEVVIDSVATARRRERLARSIRILAIFGSSEGLSPDDDLQELRLLRERHGAEITLLLTDVSEERFAHLQQEFDGKISLLGNVREFSDEIREQLTRSSWDILFFAGHSYSERELNDGYLLIGQGNRVSITTLLPDLRRAAIQGLKIAIFNSCDGLTIAEKVSSANVPTVIVFREPVPDLIARRFLKEFLREFSLGVPFYRASRMARGALLWHEGDARDPYPSATWLPIIYQNYLQPEWLWTQSTANPDLSVYERLRSFLAELWNTITRILLRNRASKLLAFISLILLGFALVNFFPIVLDRGLEFWFQDQIRPYISAVPANDNIKRQISVLESDRNQPIALIKLLNNLSSTSKQDVYRIVALAKDIATNPKLDEQLLRGIAQMQLEQNCRIDFENTRELNFRTLQQACSAEGLKLFIDLIEDHADEETARTVARSFLSLDILGVVGFSYSGTTFAANEVLEDKKTIIVSPTSTAIRSESLLNGKTGKYVFRTAVNNGVAARNLAQFMESRPPGKIAVVYDKGEPHNDSFIQLFSNKVGKENVVILPECNLYDAPENGSEDFESESSTLASRCLKAIRQNVPQAQSLLLVPGTTTSSSALRVVRGVLQDRTSQFSYLLGSGTIYKDELRNIFTDYYQKDQSHKVSMVITIPWHRALNVNALPNSAFQKRAKLIWGTDDINWQTVTGFDAAKAMVEAFKTAKQNHKPNRTEVQRILSNQFSANGATSKIKFDDNGDRIKQPDLGILIQVELIGQRADFVKLPQ